MVRIARWNPQKGWEMQPVATEDLYSIAVTAMQELVVGYHQAGSILVKTLTAGVWKDHAPPVELANVNELRMALDSKARPVIAALVLGTPRTIAILRWNGTIWERGPYMEAPSGANVALALDRHERPAIAWSEQPGGAENERIRVIVSNR